jgi:hypothetical protein
MIESLLAIVDRLIKLAEHRNRGLRAAFDEIYTPIFQDLTVVHAEYGRLLELIERLLPESERYATHVRPELQGNSNHEHAEPKSIDELVEYLYIERQRFEPVRLRLMQMLLAVDYSEVEPASAQRFLDSVVRYFPRGCWIAELWKLRRDERWGLPESTEGLLAAEDNWSKRLLGVLESYRHALAARVEENERDALLDLIEFFLRSGYSEVCSAYADLKIEIVRLKA